MVNCSNTRKPLHLSGLYCGFCSIQECRQSTVPCTIVCTQPLLLLQLLHRIDFPVDVFHCFPVHSLSGQDQPGFFALQSVQRPLDLPVGSVLQCDFRMLLQVIRPLCVVGLHILFIASIRFLVFQKVAVVFVIYRCILFIGRIVFLILFQQLVVFLCRQQIRLSGHFVTGHLILRHQLLQSLLGAGQLFALLGQYHFFLPGSIQFCLALVQLQFRFLHLQAGDSCHMRCRSNRISGSCSCSSGSNLAGDLVLLFRRSFCHGLQCRRRCLYSRERPICRRAHRRRRNFFFQMIAFLEKFTFVLRCTGSSREFSLLLHFLHKLAFVCHIPPQNPAAASAASITSSLYPLFLRLL